MFVALEGFMILLLLVGVLDFKQEYFYFDLARTIVLFFWSLSYEISANLIVFRKYFYPEKEHFKQVRTLYRILGCFKFIIHW